MTINHSENPKSLDIILSSTVDKQFNRDRTKSPQPQDKFVDDVLARVGELTQAGQFDQGARTVDDALAELTRRESEQKETFRRTRISLLEAGIDQDILRRDAGAVADRVEKIAALHEPEEVPKTKDSDGNNRNYGTAPIRGTSLPRDVVESRVKAAAVMAPK